MSRMEDGLIAANDNGLSWRRQILWRKADHIISLLEANPYFESEKKRIHDYLRKMFRKLDRLESHS